MFSMHLNIIELQLNESYGSLIVRTKEHAQCHTYNVDGWIDTHNIIAKMFSIFTMLMVFG